MAALALLCGVLSVQWLSRLPPPWCATLIMPGAALIAWRCPRCRWLACFLFGMAWAAWHGSAAMDARLPRSLEGRDFVVVGTLVDLPQARTDASRFTLRVEQASLDGEPVALRGDVTVSWYDGAPTLQPCARWHLLLRLKRPRGLLDPGSTDSERSALERGIVATGYVRDAADNAPAWRDALVCQRRARRGGARHRRPCARSA